MSVSIYGTRNCNTMKKAFDWLERHDVEFSFHDYRKSGIDAATLARWCDRAGWQALVNTRGTTWRKLDASQQAIRNAADAMRLMAAHTSVIRRPVVETSSGELLVGFDPERFASALGSGVLS
ncbi:ArsC family reductase [Rhodocyclaceae bacterium SMB388]